MQQVGKALSTRFGKAPQERQPLSSFETDLVAISETVSRLLGHFWTANDTTAARQAQIEDWLEDLREFRSAIVAEACTEIRHRPGTKRPMPGDVRILCLDIQRRNREQQLAIEAKNAAQHGGTWESWLFDIWGPASTGRIARKAAIQARHEAYRLADEWRAKQLGKPLPAPCYATATERTYTKAEMEKAIAELGIQTATDHPSSEAPATL